MAIISQEDLPKIRKRHHRQKIVFCSGTFDLTHAGHILFLEDCKAQGDLLVVGIGHDNDISMIKGPSRPILNEQIRLYTISQLKPSDYCFITKPTPPYGAPLYPLCVIFQNLQPNINVVNEDAFDIPSRQTIAKRYGVQFLTLQRRCPPEFQNISTTGLIRKIKDLP